MLLIAAHAGYAAGCPIRALEVVRVHEDFGDVGRLVKAADNAITREINNEMRVEGTTSTQVEVLTRLARAPGGTLSFKELEVASRVSQPSMWGVVSRLEKAGLVITEVHPEDARARLVHITPAGLAKLEGCQEILDSVERRIASCMTEAERDELINLLNRIIIELD